MDNCDLATSRESVSLRKAAWGLTGLVAASIGVAASKFSVDTLGRELMSNLNPDPNFSDAVIYSVVTPVLCSAPAVVGIMTGIYCLSKVYKK